MRPSSAIAFPPVEKARVRAAAVARLTGQPPRPTFVGRYRVLERIGIERLLLANDGLPRESQAPFVDPESRTGRPG